MLLTLSAEGSAIKGTLVRPKHFRVDQEAYFHHVQPPLVERALVGRTTEGGDVELAEDDGDHALVFRVVDSGRAQARPADAPDYTAPWIFERVTSDAPLVVTNWGHEPESPEMAAARDRLIQMAQEDQAVRQGKISWGDLERITAKHKPEILRIHAQYGWPKRSKFGVDAADAFWLLVQHQDHALQKRLLPELERLVEQGEASRQNYTLLFDRVRRGDGKPQLYGNSAQCEDGKAVLDPVEDEEHLVKRRAELHLPPIDEYLAQLQAVCMNQAP